MSQVEPVHVTTHLRFIHEKLEFYLCLAKEFSHRSSACDVAVGKERHLIWLVRDILLALIIVENACQAEGKSLLIEIERELVKIKRILLTQRDRWGWTFLFDSDFATEVGRRLEQHKSTHLIPLLRASLTWRLSASEPNKLADDYTNQARAMGLEPLPITTEEARKLAEKLHVQYCDSPALGEVLPCPIGDELETLEKSGSVLRRIVPNLLTPERIAELNRESEEIQREFIDSIRLQKSRCLQILEETLPVLRKVLGRMRIRPYDPTLAELPRLANEIRRALTLWSMPNPYEGQEARDALELEFSNALSRFSESLGTMDISLSLESARSLELALRALHPPITDETVTNHSESAHSKNEESPGDAQSLISKEAFKKTNRGTNAPDYDFRDKTFTPLQKKILKTLLELRAFDQTTRKTSADVLKEANETLAQSGHDKNSISDLSRDQLIGSKTGSGGGIWLTAAGKTLAERLKTVGTDS